MTTKSQKTNADIAALLRARNTLLWIVTREEVRVERAIVEAAGVAGYEPVCWDVAAGLTSPAGQVLDDSLRDPNALVSCVRDNPARRVYLARDLPPFLRDPIVCRGVRNLARSLSGVAREAARAIVILSPSSEIPPELAGHAIVIEYPLPEREEIAAILDDVLAALPPELAATAAPNGTRERAIDSAVGLTAEEAANCYAKSLVCSRTIDPATISAEKRRVIAREKVLTWYDPDPRGLDAVGGLAPLKTWLKTRRSAFSQKAKAFGLLPPKGVLLVGVPGGGKSLMAKAIATAWEMPLLRLDLGALKSKFVGESEGNIRKALAVAEAVSPCVLWLDEIEKALAGSTGPQGDGGVSSDALGAVLSWMQERSGSVFVVATSNDVSALPPELLRKGRFDELFFVDVPTTPERREIAAVSLRALGRDPDSVDLDRVARETAGFTGAEIAAIVPDALFAAFNDGERAITTDDLSAAASTVVPLTKTAAEKIEALRTWAKGRARPASTPEVVTATAGRKLDL